jgi:hypothetical protein
MNKDGNNLKIVRESFGRVVYSHKTHEKSAEFALKYARDIKIINIALLVVTSSSLLGSLITNSVASVIVGSIFSALALCIALVQLSYNPELDAANHKRVALELWYVRERYVHLIGEITSQRLSEEEIASQRDDLIKELSLIYKLALPTDSKAYDAAKKALKCNEELTFSDSEIDAFLPNELRSTQ